MSYLQDAGAAEIKEPFFDRPKVAGAASTSISHGTRVKLKFHGKQLSAQVTAVERLGTSFVGCVRGVSSNDASQDGLAPGDHVRFRLDDVCQID